METGYITSAAKAEQLPVWDYPEIAFVGRSNSGKSTLLNGLLDHNGLARTSSTPGRTQMVNFFYLRTGEQQLVFADLPGYGFSATGGKVRDPWVTLVNSYLKRSQIQEVLFLADIRRVSPLLAEDLELLRKLAKVPHARVRLILTKADKINQKDAAAALKTSAQQLAKLKIRVDTIAMVSALKKKGLEALKNDLLSYLDL